MQQFCAWYTEDLCTQGNGRSILKFRQENNTQLFPKVTLLHLPHLSILYQLNKQQRSTCQPLYYTIHHFSSEPRPTASCHPLLSVSHYFRNSNNHPGKRADWVSLRHKLTVTFHKQRQVDSPFDSTKVAAHASSRPRCYIISRTLGPVTTLMEKT